MSKQTDLDVSELENLTPDAAPLPNNAAKDAGKKDETKEEDPFVKLGKFYEQLISGEFVVDANDLVAAAERMFALDKRTNPYSAGEVEIFTYMQDPANFTLEMLLSAGTKPLDAILAVTYANDKSMVGMFAINPSTITDQTAASKATRRSIKAISALYEFFMTRGSAPKPNSSAPLSRNIVERTLGDYKVKTEEELSGLLTSSNVSKFPIKMLFAVPTSVIDPVTLQRVEMSRNGCKFIRYAVMANMFDDKNIHEENAEEIAKMSEAEAAKERLRIEKANTQLEAARAMRRAILAIPQSKKICFHAEHERAVLKHGQLSHKLTRACIESLLPVDQKRLASHIKDKKMAALLKDTAIVKDDSSGMSFSCLAAPDLKWETITVAWIKEYTA